VTPQPPLNPKADAYAARAVELSRAAFGRVRHATNIAYGPEAWQKLDVFRPAEGEALPVLLFLHGGGWTHGFKEWCGFMAPAVTAMPAVLVTSAYRLMPDHPYPGAVQDSFMALRWIFDNIRGHGGDPWRLHAGGHSAGGHIAALLALRHDWREDAAIPEAALRGCFPISATFSTRMVNVAFAPLYAPSEPFEVARPDSPLLLAAASRVAWHIAWGDAERDWVQQSGAAMVAALGAAGSAVSVQIREGYDHFRTHLATQDADDPWCVAVGRQLRDGVAA
jgi:acetyl esterase/lipase